ncbi:TPA: 30S ribosomal protein S3, partial [Candidatus Poribacteria bacterium]|nr:30S ribosomal protein S3 [Candidatus Poribacteria bacterium]
MGQKTHPRGLRLGIIETWDSIWYEKKDYAKWLHEDLTLQKFIKERLYR